MVAEHMDEEVFGGWSFGIVTAASGGGFGRGFFFCRTGLSVLQLE